MTVELGKKIEPASAKQECPAAAATAADEGGGLGEEEKVALQMIEELLNRNWSPRTGIHGTVLL